MIGPGKGHQHVVQCIFAIFERIY